MNKGAYRQYLRSQNWQKIRFEVLKRSNSKCEMCGYQPWKRGVLQIHHLSYENVGHETADDLICVCARCHMELHGISGKRKPENVSKGMNNRPSDTVKKE